MNRYAIPATVYVDAHDLAHAVDIFFDLCAPTRWSEGFEIDPESGMVVYLNEKVVKEAERQRFVRTEENDLNADYIAD